MAIGQNLWCHIWVDEHPFTIYFDVHQGYRVLTHGHMCSHTSSYILGIETHILNINSFSQHPAKFLEPCFPTQRLCVGSSSGKSCNSTCRTRSKRYSQSEKPKGCLCDPILRYMEGFQAILCNTKVDRGFQSKVYGRFLKM